jgi:hypothetical protein
MVCYLPGNEISHLERYELFVSEYRLSDMVALTDPLELPVMFGSTFNDLTAFSFTARNSCANMLALALARPLTRKFGNASFTGRLA